MSAQGEVDFLDLAKGYSHQNEQANKRWIITATIAFFTLNLDPSSGKQVLFGTEINPENIHVILTLLLSLTTVVYVVAHVGAYKTAKMFQQVCRENRLNELSVSSEFTVSDHLYSQITSNYNRIWPLFEKIRNRTARKWLYKPTKIVVDTVQIAISPLAILSILPELELDNLFGCAALVAAAVAILASIHFWFVSLGYVIKVEA